MVESRKEKVAFKIALSPKKQTQEVLPALNTSSSSQPCAEPASVQVESCEVRVAATPWEWKQYSVLGQFGKH